MDDPRSVIERSLNRVGSESYTLESFYRRRDRTRARQRVTAGIVGLTIAIAIVIVIAVVGSAMLRSAPEHPPADTKGTPILREGEVLQVEDRNGPTATLVATDLETGTQRFLHRCADCGYIQEFALSAEGGWFAWEQGCAGGGTEPCTPGLWVGGADGPPVIVTVSGGTNSGPPGWVWAWSPVTEQLAFATQRSSSAELVLLDLATDEATSIPTVTGISSLSWSPDGTKVAVASPSSGAYVVDLSTGGSTEIGQVGAVEEVSWSPDGTRIALVARSDGRDRIIVVNADGSDQRVLVDHRASILGAPAWSPDGTSIAYFQDPSSGGNSSPDVWVVGSDGSDATQLLDSDCERCGGGELGPFWSPDGSRIAFWIYREVPFGSYLVVNADGTSLPEGVDDVVVDGWIQG
jgi:hypothetical protein